jgi:hypothetical protein
MITRANTRTCVVGLSIGKDIAVRASIQDFGTQIEERLLARGGTDSEYVGVVENIDTNRT